MKTRATPAATAITAMGAADASAAPPANDNRADARKLSARFPMPYPSVEDPRMTVAGRYGAIGLPATAFYDARGRFVVVHQGGFTRDAQLAAQIERYALR